MDKSLKRATLYGDRAKVSPKGSEEQKKYAKLAFAEFDSLMEIVDPSEDIEAQANVLYSRAVVISMELKMNLLHARAMTISMAGQPEEAIAVITEALVLDEKYPGVLPFEQVALVKHGRLKHTRIVANGTMQ